MKHVRSLNMKAIVLFLFVVLMLAIAGCHDTYEDGVYASGGGRGDEEIQTPTGPMVLIPAGEFTMGTTSEQEQWLRDKGWWHDWMANEQPAATVYLDAYYIDKYEVTNAQYGEFMKATGRSAPLYWNDSK
jgi:formylglycine-generating enzyme required for sulfatase activity